MYLFVSFYGMITLLMLRFLFYKKLMQPNQWENDDPWEIDESLDDNSRENEWYSGREWIGSLGREYSQENLTLLGDHLDQKIIQGLISLDGVNYNFNNFSTRLRFVIPDLRHLNFFSYLLT